MNPFDILLIGTVGLCAGCYILGRFHGARKIRKSTARFLKAMQSTHITRAN